MPIRKNFKTPGEIVTDAHIADGTVHFVEGDIDHDNIQNVGNNDHAEIDDVISYWNNINSSGRIWGGEIISGTSAGTVSVSAGGGLMKNESATPQDIPTGIDDGQGSELSYITWDTVEDIELADESYTYIYIDGIDSIKTTTDFDSIDFTQAFTVGKVYRSGDEVHIRQCGTNLWNFNRRVQLFGEEYFKVLRARGLNISNPSGLYIAYDSGVMWAEIVNRFLIDAFDSSGTDRFIYWHRDGSGGWTRVPDRDIIDNTYYDNNAATLAELTATRYGVHWVYVLHDSTCHVVYGQGNYTLAQSGAAQPPSSLPGKLAAYATLIGKIRVKKGEATLYSIESAFEASFSPSLVTNHNDLSNIQGGTTTARYHLSENEHTDITGLYDGYDTEANILGKTDLGLDGEYWLATDTKKVWKATNNGGTLEWSLWLVLAQTETVADNNFLTAYDDATGAFSKTRPTWGNIDKTVSNINDITTKSHTSLTDIGSNTHATIDTHISNTQYDGYDTEANILGKTDLGLDGEYWLATDTKKVWKATNNGGTLEWSLWLVLAQTETVADNNFLTAYDATTGAFSKTRPTWGNIDKTVSNINDITTKSHTSLTDIGSNTHANIDTHIGDGTIHFVIGDVTQKTNFGTKVTTTTFNASRTNHNFKYTEVEHADDITITIPEDEFIEGDTFSFEQTGAGNLEVVVANGTNQSINTRVKTLAQGDVITVICKDHTSEAEVFFVIGGIE